MIDPHMEGVCHASVFSLSPMISPYSYLWTPTKDLFNSEQGDINFCGVSWQAAAVLIAKFQIGLGALSLPSTFHTLGFFPGIFCFIIISLISTVAGYLCGNARQYYPHMHSIGDAAELLFGKGARDLVGFIYYIYLAMVAGAGMLTTSVAFNALSDHGTCTIIFVAVACIAAFLIGTGFRALEKVAWISWVGVACIFAAIWTTAIACLTQDHPAAGPATGPIDLDIRILPKTSFSEAMTAIANQLFAVGASGTFFSISAEMKHPEKFTRSLLWGQGFIVLTCLAIASIVYGKVGQFLASPALGSGGPLIKKVSYGIALPGLLVTAVLFSHIAAKYLFVRILRGTEHLQHSTVKHWTVWIGSMLVTVIFGFIIVGVVPFFGDFLSLVGALVNPVFTNVVPGFMLLFYIARQPPKVAEGAQPLREEETTTGRHWLIDSLMAYKRGWKIALLVILGIFMIFSGAFIIIGGTYSSVLSIKRSYDEGSVSGVFSCGDNSA
ncbi:transmembrane amino acid transporter protein-domain-containing protein [Dactylonectria estremocensis]|uniref:Transmembrane amino acid transporter protein-domain-containing protein n=1 Tax=Dactylonectria estremocensis TaxID=1079267 RepID=A0A9P9ESL5_9HYPO|nr:transmembrane amino acid transporter protein-domain-containing protein [Dactylonectria estremocensis]